MQGSLFFTIFVAVYITIISPFSEEVDPDELSETTLPSAFTGRPISKVVPSRAKQRVARFKKRFDFFVFIKSPHFIIFDTIIVYYSHSFISSSCFYHFNHQMIRKLWQSLLNSKKLFISLF